MKVKFLLLMPLMILAQEWSAVTAIKEFDGLKYYDGAIYAASKGGLLKISESGTYTYLNRVNGLAGTRVRNMATKNDQFYVLTENNALSILENNVWSTPTSVAIDEWEDFMSMTVKYGYPIAVASFCIPDAMESGSFRISLISFLWH
jgi:hypothetical protein